MTVIATPIRIAVTALALGLSLGMPSYATQDAASRIDQKVEQLSQAGQFAAAIPLARQLVALRERALGPDHAQVADAINTLGVLNYNQGSYADAERLYKRSLAIFEKTLGPDHTEVASSLNNLGELHRTQERLDEAEPLLKRSLDLTRRRAVATLRTSRRH